jgi:cellulose biosynthesis protein BcsQ
VARVLAVANQKGGVAKTTTVHNLGAAMAEAGARVLLVDLDPQACLTYSVGLDPEALAVSLHDVLVGRNKAADVLARAPSGLDVLPATIDLASTRSAARWSPSRATTTSCSSTARRRSASSRSTGSPRPARS